MLPELLAAGTTLLALVVSASANEARQNGWPHAPFTTSGRDMIDSQGHKVVYAGVNWPGAGEVMIPEGLQYKSVRSIVSDIKSLGMNVIRLTYAIEMINDVYDQVDSSLGAAVPRALGAANGSAVLHQILAHNPTFTAATTRLQVFDAVAAECARQQIYVHLDNHMSKAAWCCAPNDGNAWFGDTHFHSAQWKRGLAFMARHAARWPAFVSTALRNELRAPAAGSPTAASYGWKVWYAKMVSGAEAVHAANPAPLIFFSGLGYDTDLAPVTGGARLPGGRAFDLAALPFRNKVVFELHNYNKGFADASCAGFGMYRQGYNAMDASSATTAKNVAPVVLSEFGFKQDGVTHKNPYPACIKTYLTRLPGGPGGWMQWVVAGSYYIRKGIQDFDETWGLYNHDWTTWRSPPAVEQFTKPFVKATLA